MNSSSGFVLLATTVFLIQSVAAQPADQGCPVENSSAGTQTRHCEGGITIVVENKARYTLRSDRNGHVEAIDLDGKALLIEAPSKSIGSKFQVITPQAIAAVRGTKWAIDVAEDKTSVLVLNGQVAVGRRTGNRSVTLGPGEGIDVRPGAPLTAKRWSAARVSALLARLGQ